MWSLGRLTEALAALDAVLAAEPERETALDWAGHIALDLNRLDEARGYLERVVQVNPRRWHYHHGLAVASFRRGEWERGVRECREALRFEPFNTGSRSLLVQCYLAMGHADDALTEYETIRQLTPENRREGLRRWFEGQQRRLATQP